MKFYVRQAVFPFFYMIFVSLMSFFISLINILWVREILYLLSLSVYFFIIGASFFQRGQEAIKTRETNDMERREIIRTGEDRPLKLDEEYQPWKGFFIGFIVTWPLIFLMLLHFILTLVTNGTFLFFGGAANVVYLAFYAPYSVLVLIDGAIISAWHYFFVLYAVPVIICLAGVCYILGAKKQQREIDKIEDTKKSIYGDKK